jgi:hypothetical protein
VAARQRAQAADLAWEQECAAVAVLDCQLTAAGQDALIRLECPSSVPRRPTPPHTARPWPRPPRRRRLLQHRCGQAWVSSPRCHPGYRHCHLARGGRNRARAPSWRHPVGTSFFHRGTGTTASPQATAVVQDASCCTILSSRNLAARPSPPSMFPSAPHFPFLT